MDFKLIGEVMAALTAATVVLCLLGGLVRHRWAAGTWAVLLALAVAPLAADKPFLGERPQWHATDPDFRDAVQRVILCVPAVAVVAAVLAARRVPWWARAVLAAAAPAAILYWVQTAYPGPPLADWPHRLAVPAAASLALWLLVEPLAVRRPTGIAVPWVCGCLAAGAGLMNLFSTSTAPGWVALALGGVIGGTFLVALTGRGPSVAGGPVAVVAPVLVTTVMVHRLGGGEVPVWQWLLLGAAPALAWAVELRPMRTWRPWLRESLRVIVVAVPVVVAVVPTYRAHAAEEASQSGQSTEPGW